MRNSTSIINFKEAGIAEIRTDVNTSHRSLFAKKKIETGDVISHFNWDKVFKTPTYLTVQIGENEHIELKPTFLECINHSCEPNSFFDIHKKELICLKPIQKGEEFTFFYPSAEWNMDQPFECLCESKDCIGFVRGALHLTNEQRNHYRFTDFIQQKMKA